MKYSEDESSLLKPDNSQMSERCVLSVSDLNRAIKQELESEFPLVWVQGELSNFTAHRSGHWYFSLKDKNSQISGVMFKGHNMRLVFKPEVGMEVLVRARVSVYEPRGSYQLAVELMEPVGAGALQKQFEQLKKKLALEGLFEQSRKKPIPSFPERIAIVSSPTGAAIRDIIHVIERRYPKVELDLFPCRVQGDGASKEILKALEFAISVGTYDSIIIGRGGGSMEDLWCFNDEALARAIAACPIPTISAVGHEIDFTISDFVADLRAPTPSAAAELAVPNQEDLQKRLQQAKRSLWQVLKKNLQFKRQALGSLSRALVHPKKDLERRQQNLDELQWRLESILTSKLQLERAKLQSLQRALVPPKLYISQLLLRLKNWEQDLIKSFSLCLKQKRTEIPTVPEMQSMSLRLLQDKRKTLAQMGSQLNALSPLAVLDRGYSLVKVNNQVIKKAADLPLKQKFAIQFQDGELQAQRVE